MVEKIKLEEKSISKILEKYDLGKVLEVYLIKKGSVHSNHVLTTTKGKFILRVYQERTNEQIILEMKLLKRLSNVALPIPKVILNMKKEFITEYENKKIGIFTFLEGEHIKDKDATLKQIESIGFYMGKFHKNLEGFKPKEVLSKHNYDEKWVRQLLVNVKKDLPDLPISYQKYVLETLDNLKISQLPQGLNHGDLHDDNVLFKGDNVSGILDFDDCFYGNILSDVGSGIAFWCIDNEIDFKKCRSFIKAYEKERKLTSKEKEFLYEQTQLFMLIHLMYWLWKRENWKNNIKPFKVLNNLKKITKEKFIKKIF